MIREVPNEITLPPQPVAPEPQRRRSPAELELDAEKTFVKAESARLYREAGDAYLSERGDYQAALRCYRNFLDESLPADRAVNPHDTWMLISLKRAREQESNP